MPRALSGARLVELMQEDARLQADIARLGELRTLARDQVVAELQRRKVTELTVQGHVIALKQQRRAYPSVPAAKERLADRPEVLVRVITEVVDTNELKALVKAGVVEQADVDFIAPLSPHGSPYPTLAVAAKVKPRKP